MRKNRIKLTESQLNKVIKESVEQVLNEISRGLAQRAYDEMVRRGQHERARDFANKYRNVYKPERTIPDLPSRNLFIKHNDRERYERDYDIDDLDPNLRTNDPRTAREMAKAYNNWNGYKLGDKGFATPGHFRK